MTMTVHTYRPRQFHRTSNGENPSNGYRDMGSASLAAACPAARPPGPWRQYPSSPEGWGVKRYAFTGIILWMHPSKERQRYIVTSSHIGWVHTQNDPSLHSHNSCWLRIHAASTIFNPLHAELLWCNINSLVPGRWGFQMCKFQLHIGDWYFEHSSKYQPWMNAKEPC